MGEQQFWEQLKQKYEEKNRALQQREQELRLRLEAMDTIIGDSNQRSTSTPISPTMRSCTCEKPGFFKGLFSMFSAKPQSPVSCVCSEEPRRSQSPPPRAPQDIPTKESKIKSNQNRNPNCACDPCAAENELKEKDENVCDCSICSKMSLGDGTNRKLCPCNITSDNDCDCNLAETELPIKADRTKVKQEVIAKGSISAPSKFSLKSMDLHYMQDIQNLASQQKNLLKDINDLEQKSKIYENVFGEYKNIDFSAKDRSCKCCSDTKPSNPNEKTNAELKLENFLLKNELKDMRLEVRQYLERMEGPMQFKIESERYKVQQLEEKLEYADAEYRKLNDFYEKEINALKMDLCAANTITYNLHAANESLRQELQDCHNKCVRLEEDLIRQKISEADTIKSLQATLNERIYINEEKEECELHKIARELSKILKECEPCGECINLPADLTAAAKLLKSLTDMVDIKLNKADKDENEVTSDENAKVDVLEIIAFQEIIGDSSAQDIITSTATAISVDMKSEVTKETNSEQDVPAISTPPPVDDKILEVISSVKNTEKEETQFTPTDIQVESETPDMEENEFSPLPLAESTQLPKSKLSCCCVKSKSKEVDQLWPKIDEPIMYKDSELLNTPAVPSKKSCDCSISKKLKESGPKEQVESERKIAQNPTRNSLCKCSSKKSGLSGMDSAAPMSLVPADALGATERFKLLHHVTASKSQDLLKSETNIKCLEVKENFPFDVDTKVDIINKPPAGVHVTTTITDSGILEVITEGPEGVIETTLVYTKSGNVEVVTEIFKYSRKDKSCKKPFSIKTPDEKSLEAPPNALKTTVSEPGKPSRTASDPGPVATKSSCLCDECPDPRRGFGQPSEIQPISELQMVKKQSQTMPEEATGVDEQSNVAKALSFSLHDEGPTLSPDDDTNEAT